MEKRLLDHQALPNLIKEKIIDEIMQGQVQAGDKLVEAKYSEAFGTSRAPVREAFYLLSLEGFVQKTPRKGTIVKGFTNEEILDILEIRNYLEILSINRMVFHDNSVYLDQMRMIIEEMKQKKGNRKDYAQLNYQFHYQLILASRSEVIKNTYLRIATPLISLQTISFMKDEAVNRSLQEHIEITQNLSDGKVDEAQTLLTSHNMSVYPRVRG